MEEENFPPTGGLQSQDWAYRRNGRISRATDGRQSQDRVMIELADCKTNTCTFISYMARGPVNSMPLSYVSVRFT